MMESNDTQAKPASGYVGLAHASSGFVDQNRTAWILRPDEFLEPGARIRVDAGFATLTRGGWIIHEDPAEAGMPPMTVDQAEVIAQRAPEQEWCIHLVGASAESHYRRVGPAQWKLYKWGASLVRVNKRRLPHRWSFGEVPQC